MLSSRASGRSFLTHKSGSCFSILRPIARHYELVTHRHLGDHIGSQFDWFLAPKFQNGTKVVEQKGNPIDYTCLTADSQVIFFGDIHSKHSIRDHLYGNIPALRRSGITHFTVEVPTTKGAFIPLDYRKLYDTLGYYGINVVPVDIDQSTNPSAEEREAFIAANIIGLLESTPGIKLAIVFGEFHLTGLPFKFPSHR
ncbi:BTB/POZ fold protein [Penicillium sp. IBT 18751x]|nr:BTB/POZ fold protein [Penicillium sp. IBT 18751x]KAJ6117816.1 BTB/POZ fold protein [Penicillium sp. IBT 18751x]